MTARQTPAPGAEQAPALLIRNLPAPVEDDTPRWERLVPAWIVSGVIHVVLLALFLLVGPTGIAIAAALAGWINVGLLAAALRRREDLALDRIFRRRFLGIVAASTLMGGIVFALVQLLEPWFAPASGSLAQGAALSALVGTGLIVYLAAALLFGATRLRELIRA